VKQRLAAVRMLFSYLASGAIFGNPVTEDGEICGRAHVQLCSK
jgi:hypothetical protein